VVINVLDHLLLAGSGFIAWIVSTAGGGGGEADASGEDRDIYDARRDGGQLWLLGIAAGAGALAPNWLAKRLLKDMPEERFRAVVVGFMGLSGIVMIGQQRQTVANLLG
jgi:hypothetical protein